MQRVFKHRCWSIALMALLIFAGPLAAPRAGAAATSNATLQPSQISLGQSAQLEITTSGMSADAIKLPEVAGLDFRVTGQKRQIEIINGATLLTTAVIVRVTPQTAGTFTIPALTPQSQPLILRVKPDSAVPGRSSDSTIDGIRMTADGAAFSKLVTTKHDAYVGESIPVDIEVGLRAGFVTSFNGLPTLSGGEFTLDNLSQKPQQVEKIIDGKPYILLIWHSVIAPVKPGKFRLAAATPLTVRVRTSAPRESMLEDLLGDPFMQNFFGTTVSKEITVTSPVSDLTVSPLPSDGRPPGFSGAVGTFKITSELSAKSAAVGDPLTLRMHVTGAGNFDRVDSPMLQHLDDWKTYPPKSSFKASDSIGFTGEKTFEQPLIPAKPGLQTLPGIEFVYFDPAARRYATARSTPLSITVSPSAADRSLQASTGGSVGGPPVGVAPTPPPGLRADHPAGPARHRSLVPLFLEPRFLAAPALIAALCGGWLMWTRRPTAIQGRRRNGDADRLLRELEDAAHAGQAHRFFTLARQALLETMADRWQIVPERLTAADIDARLGADGAPVRRLLELADEANYSGAIPTAIDLEGWLRLVRQFAADPAQNS